VTDRLLDYLFGFLLIVLFVVIADSSERIWMVAALGLGTVGVLYTFLNNSLTIDGAGAALVTGVAAMGLWAWTGAGLLLFFFFSSYALAQWLTGSDRKKKTETDQPGMPESDKAEKAPAVATERRTGMQVWANAFWFVFFVFVFFLINEQWAAVAAVAALAAATSDTWSSVAGERLAPQAKMITTFRTVPAGTDGAVSYPGTLAGFAGALAVTVLFLVLSFNLDIRALWVILLSGFSGCIADSYLGAIFQAHNMPGRWFDDSGKGAFSRVIRKCIPDNNGVNFLSSGFAAFLALMLY